MPSKNEKCLLLLCGVSAVVLQFSAESLGPTGMPSRLVGAAQAQEASCFIAGTAVLMADGTERPIETIVLGDAVLGRRGRVNRVVACDRTYLGRRRLHGFNGCRPFVTAEHPFLTDEGWKALDPEATRRDTAHPHVGPLQLGHSLCRAAARSVGTGDPRGLIFLQASIELEAITAIDAPPDTLLFNLFLDGDHSYVANGWIVHNKDGKGGGAAVTHDRRANQEGSAGGSGTATRAADGPADRSEPAADNPSAPGAGTGRAAGAGSAEGRARTGVRTTSTNAQAPRRPAAPSALESLLRSMGLSDSREVGLDPAGPPLSRDQEKQAIERHWRQRD